MKSLTLTVFVLSLMSLASCREQFNYGPANGTVCFRAVFEAAFNLTFEDNNGTFVRSFDLPKKADVDVDGSCPEDNMATLNLTFVVEETSLIFTIENNGGEISGDLQVVLLDPSVTFENVTYTSQVSLNGPGRQFSQMGTVNNSYMCNAAEPFTLVSNQSDVKASASIVFTSFQLQAFNLPAKKNFSGAFDCEADRTTTASTTLPTTTLPTPSGTGDYIVKNGNETCLRMEANITISVQYQNKTGGSVTREVMIPKDAQVNGTCGETISMKLSVKSDSEYWNGLEEEEDYTVDGELYFTFAQDKRFTFIQECGFELNFSDSNATIQSQEESADFLSLTNKFYTCDSETLAMDTGNDEVVLRNLTVQAFGLDMGNFSQNGLDCHQMPPKAAPSDNYTVSDGNVTCISLSSALTLQITYETEEKKNKSIPVNFEKHEPALGECSNGASGLEYITIMYKKRDFMLTFQFAKDTQKVSTGLGADAFSYYVNAINVTHTLNEDIFPDAMTKGETFHSSLANQKLYETTNDKYYKCAAETTFKISDSVSVVTKDMRLVAFNSNTKQPNLFGDNVNECTADTETNSIVPIAVGAALAGLVVIVLIAYLIGRRRNHKGYESV